MKIQLKMQVSRRLTKPQKMRRDFMGFPSLDISSQAVTNLAVLEETRLLNSKFEKIRIILDNVVNNNLIAQNENRKLRAAVERLKKKMAKMRKSKKL